MVYSLRVTNFSWPLRCKEVVGVEPIVFQAVELDHALPRVELLTPALSSSDEEREFYFVGR